MLGRLSWWQDSGLCLFLETDLLREPKAEEASEMRLSTSASTLPEISATDMIVLPSIDRGSSSLLVISLPTIIC